MDRQNLARALGALILPLALMSFLLGACSGDKPSGTTGADAATRSAPSAGAAAETATRSATEAGPTATPSVPEQVPTGVESPTPTAAAPSASPTAILSPPSLADFATAIREVVNAVRPATAQITSQETQFDQFNQPFTVPAGVGSGVIYDQQGHILTNAHVVAGAQSLVVSLPDGRSFPGKLVGADSATDLAIVQISGDNLPVAPLGDSSQLQAGDWVIAIGNALALPGGPTVTEGVVSAMGRTVQEPADASGNPGPFLFDLIQTSAPINPGNSGGPLINLAGQVIGINTLVAGQAEPGVPSQGIGFAIAINTAKPIGDELVATGKVAHAYLGISYVPLSPAVAAQLGTSERQGIAVARVQPGSPAAKAGLRARDIITAIDGTRLTDESTFQRTLRTHKPGDTVTLTVVRNGGSRDLTATLGEAPSTGP